MIVADFMDSLSTESDDEDLYRVERATSKNSDKNRDFGGNRQW